MDQMHAILENETLCVLATDSQGQPHCSLMAYVYDRENRALIMASKTSTAKYRNMTANPRVCVLVDTRNKVPGDHGLLTKALTLNGVFVAHQPGDLMDLKRAFLRKHPQLEKLLADIDTVFFRICIRSVLLLDGPTDASYQNLA